MLARKNPYLLRAKGIVTPRQLIQAVLDAHLSSQEETLLGAFLEGLAIFLCRQAYRSSGKATAEGIDLEFERSGVRCLVAVKSGPNWANSSQIKRMRENFRQAAIIYRQGNKFRQIVCVNGCCYGKQPARSEDKGDYLKLCGQRFWEYITGDEEIYKRIIEPIGDKARERNEAFLCQFEIVLETFVGEFRSQFCGAHGSIDWEKLVEFSSGKPA